MGDSVQPRSLKRPLSVDEGGGDKKREKLANKQKPGVLDEEDPAISHIKQTSDGFYKLALRVDRTFFSGIVGTSGRTIRYIENRTKTELCVPQYNEKSKDVVIIGKQRHQVCAALREVRNRIATMRRKLRPTHFLAVALNTGQVRERFGEFKQNILEAKLPGIDKELFTQEHTIHLTLGIYALISDEERQRGVKELETCRSFLADLKTPFDIRVKGLEIMDDDPSHTRILFAKIESPELQKFADQCLAHFQPTGLCAKDNNSIKTIKLHMTVMNIRYRKELTRTRCSSNFDAREILKRFGDFDFGSAQCQVLHLCAMQRENDFYKIAGSLKFGNDESKTSEESGTSEELKTSEESKTPEEETKTVEELKTSEESKASEESNTLKESKTVEESKTSEESKTPEEESKTVEESKTSEKLKSSEESKTVEESKAEEESKTIEESKTSEESKISEEESEISKELKTTVELSES